MSAEESRDEIRRLKDNIKIELDLCDPNETPNVCANKGTDEGYKQIENLIIEVIINQHVTIGQAIVIVDSELNTTGYVD